MMSWRGESIKAVIPNQPKRESVRADGQHESIKAVIPDHRQTD